MKPSRSIILLAALSLTGCLVYEYSKALAPPNPVCCAVAGDESSLDARIILDGLNHPWGLAFLPDGSMLVTERGGNLKIIANQSEVANLDGLPPIASRGQGGLLDVALDPDFEQNRFVYLTYSEPDTAGKVFGTAVGRAELDTEKSRLVNFERIFTSNVKRSAGQHFGSRIRFAKDKTLFVTLGDRGKQPSAQDLFDHAGSVIRINRDGSVPPDNPYADGKKALPEIWSVGHRSPQGAAIQSPGDQLWTLSHGPRGGDEVNKIERGRNYGWPVISYGRNYSGTGFEKGHAAAGYQQPEYYWDPSIAPSGMTFYNPENASIPEWKGSLLVGALKAEYLSRLIIEDGKIVAEEKYFEGKFGRIRDVRTGTDGAIWLLTDSGNGLLIRIEKKQ